MSGMNTTLPVQTVQPVSAEGEKKMPPALKDERTIYPKFESYTLKIDATKLTENEKMALRELSEAGKALSPIYWMQCTPHSLEVRELMKEVLPHLNGQIAADAAEYLKYLEIFCGPYDSTVIASDHKKFTPNFTCEELRNAINEANIGPFRQAELLEKLGTLREPIFSLEGEIVRPATVNIYDSKITEEMLEAHKTDEGTWKLIESPYTVVGLVQERIRPVPYVKAYGNHLAEAAKHMQKAAEHARNAAKDYAGKKDVAEYYGLFSEYLIARAAAMQNTVYDRDTKPQSLYETDKMWVRLHNHPGFKIGIIIGPIEDGYLSMKFPESFPVKCAYECVIYVKDEERAALLEKFQDMTKKIVDTLDVPEEHKRLGKMPLTLALDTVYQYGETESMPPIGVHLPNPKEIVNELGSVSSIFVNATFGKCEVFSIPIAELIIDGGLTKEQVLKYLEWHVMNHETGHPLGGFKDKKIPLGNVLDAQFAGRLEELKANTVALRGMRITLPEAEREIAYKTMITDMLRLIYAGTPTYRDACMMEFNYYCSKGAIVRTPEGKLTVDVGKFDDAIGELLAELLRIEYVGDKAAAEKFVSTYRIETELLAEILTRLETVPKGVKFEFPGV